MGMGSAFLDGGCRVVQLRAKDWSRTDIERAAQALRDRCHAVGGLFILNDDPELAAAVGADGVHIGQTDASVEAARRWLPHGIVGRSTHDPQTARRAVADRVDYVAFGPCFPTPHLSRPKPLRGLDGLARVRAVLPAGFPLVAIGGITLERLPAVRSAGADAWAVIGAVANAEDPTEMARRLR